VAADLLAVDEDAQRMRRGQAQLRLAEAPGFDVGDQPGEPGALAVAGVESQDPVLGDLSRPPAGRPRRPRTLGPFARPDAILVAARRRWQQVGGHQGLRHAEPGLVREGRQRRRHRAGDQPAVDRNLRPSVLGRLAESGDAEGESDGEESDRSPPRAAANGVDDAKSRGKACGQRSVHRMFLPVRWSATGGRPKG
jgi:hypothetical protein